MKAQAVYIPRAANGSSAHLKAPARVDITLLAVTLILAAFGLLMVFSTTAVTAQERFGDSFFFARRQALAVISGLILMWCASYVPLRLLLRVSPWMLVVALALVLLPSIPGLGDSAGGATRWISLAGFRFQPGEFAKLATVLFMAGYFARHEEKLFQFWRGIGIPALIMSPILILFLIKPDFGSMVVVAAIVMCMALVSGASLVHFFISGLVLVVGGVAAVITSPYRMGRVLSFLSPWQDSQGTGYQLIQSLIAIGSGEVAGAGLGAGQQKLFFLPAAHTDFIFSVIAEELGFLGAVAVVFLFVILLWRGFVITSRLADDAFCLALGTGLTLLIVLPAFLNIGVACGLLPTKGMVLPFIAYGGSSFLMSGITVGLLLGLSRHFENGVR